MGWIKDIKFIKSNFEKITDETIKKAKAYDEIKSYLKHIKFDVKNTSVVFDAENMCYCVQIKYDIPQINIHIDKDNNIEKNDRFISINTLDLISISDMQKISSKIDEIKKMNNK